MFTAFAKLTKFNCFVSDFEHKTSLVKLVSSPARHHLSQLRYLEAETKDMSASNFRPPAHFVFLPRMTYFVGLCTTGSLFKIPFDIY